MKTEIEIEWEKHPILDTTMVAKGLPITRFIANGKTYITLDHCFIGSSGTTYEDALDEFMEEYSKTEITMKELREYIDTHKKQQEEKEK